MTNFSDNFVKLFKQFIALDCDRFSFIQKYLNSQEIENTTLCVDGKKHILATFAKTAYNRAYRLKTIIAHYDRDLESLGANDNSSSVFSLLEFTKQLKKFNGVHNVRIFFTDGEELVDGSKSVSDMGSFGLASLLKKMDITNDDIYVFDCTGRGDVPILAKTTLPQGVSKTFSKQFYDLENRTKELIKSVSPYFLTLPVSYSDNAGFLACKIPAIAITMLPSNEATSYLKNLTHCEELENYVKRHKIYDTNEKNYAEFSDVKIDLKILKEFEMRKMLPATWQIFHTKYDNFESLTEESFVIMSKILNAIALSKTFA